MRLASYGSASLEGASRRPVPVDDCVGPYHLAMRLVASVVAAAAIAVLVILAVAGSNKFSGPVLVRVGENHGIHRTDVFVAVVGATAVAAVALLARRR